MNRGRLSFYEVHHSSGDKVSPPRRFSATEALEALRHQDPALLFPTEETKHEGALPKKTTTPCGRGDSGSDYPCKPKEEEVTVTETTTTTTTAAMARERRRSSRKSVNGMVIEIDFEDESEITMFEQCDDYVDDYKPDLNRTASNESLEELRTRLEALEHERGSEQLPEHDDYGWGYECMRKQLIEALECSSTTTDSKWNSSSSILKGIPEYSAFVEDDEEEEEDDDEDEEEESVPSQIARRSTVRSSVLGLVLEYDWSLGSESDGEEHLPSDDEA